MSGIPFLVVAPTALPVSLFEAKNHLRVTHDMEDGLISDLIASQTAYLDGWNGVLGRAIMPQTWAQVWTDGETELFLALPDAYSVIVKSDGVTVSDTLYELELTGKGTKITLGGVSGSEIRVEYACQMAAAKLPLVKHLVLLMVGNAYENRSGEIGPDEAIQAKIAALRVV